MADYNATNYPAFSDKIDMLKEIHRVAHAGGDVNHLVKRLARTDMTALSNATSWSESTYTTNLPHF